MMDWWDVEEPEPKCWCEQDKDRPEPEFPESYKEDHMIYEPNREGFSPFAAFVSVIMLSLVICLLISLVS